MTGSILEALQAEANHQPEAEKKTSGGVFSQTDVHHVHHVHQFEPDDRELERCVAVVEDVIRRGKDEPGLYGSDAFKAAWGFICKNSDEQRFRLRVEIKKNKPSGVPLDEIDGFGSGGESGEERNSGKDEVYKQLYPLFERQYIREDGAILPIDAVAIDCGYHTDQVYYFIQVAQRMYSVFAVMWSGNSLKGPLVKEARAWNRRLTLWLIDADTAKNIVLARLEIEPDRKSVV